MLGKYELREIRKLTEREPNAALFRDIRLTSTICSTQGRAAEPITLAAAADAAFHPPAHIFGVPFDAACLDGVTIPAQPIGIPAILVHRLHGGKVIGFTGAMDAEGRLFSKGFAQEPADIARLVKRNAGDQDGFIVRQEHGNLVARYGCAAVPKHFAGTAVFLQNSEPGNYGRFVLGVLPQLVYLKELGLPFDYYIGGDRAAWLAGAIATLGLPDKPILTVREVCGDTFDTLLMLDDVHGNGVLAPHVQDTYRQMAQAFGARSKRPGIENIYVSRALSRTARPGYRVMANEVDEIERAAADRGFTVVYPETLQWAEQLAMFHHARRIAGPSGSGMLNAVFAAPGTGLLDIESFHTTVRQHARAYATTGKRYAFAFGAIDPEDKNPNVGFRSWSLPLEVFHQGIDWLLG
jgi:hypothetical protein